MSNTTQKIGNYRWTIVSLLLFATTVNYMDRNVIGFLKDYFCSEEGFGWTPQMYSYLTSFFTGFYAGQVLDRVEDALRPADMAGRTHTNVNFMLSFGY